MSAALRPSRFLPGPRKTSAELTGFPPEWYTVPQGKAGGAKSFGSVQRTNTKSDSFNLATVIFSLTLFLPGIVGTFKDMPNRIAVMSVSVVAQVFAFLYMYHIPLPTEFGQMNFF